MHRQREVSQSLPLMERSRKDTEQQLTMAGGKEFCFMNLRNGIELLVLILKIVLFIMSL